MNIQLEVFITGGGQQYFYSGTTTISDVYYSEIMSKTGVQHLYNQGGILEDCNDTKLPSYFPLSKSIVENVERFVFFVGYPRSGHSMIGSVLDAHPDMIIAHEYFLFEKCSKLLRRGQHLFRDKYALFNALFANSYLTSTCGWRSNSKTKKGYNFDFGLEWQGKFRALKVIGDKSGGSATKCIRKGTMCAGFGEKCLSDITSLKMPVLAIHVIRNPFDIIATSALINSQSIYNKTSQGGTVHNVTMNELFKWAKKVFGYAGTVNNTIARAPKLGIDVLEIYIEDFIRDPATIVRSICTRLGVDCPQDYVDNCASSTFRNVSRSRDLVRWHPIVIRFINKIMDKFPFFRGYTLESSFRNVYFL